MTRDHYPMLDLLRGVAALLVLLFHLGQVTGHPRLISEGYLAVDFFFMLSGFVMGAAYEGRLATDLSLSRFMLLRLIRLYPVALLGLLIGLLLAREPGSVGAFALQAVLLPLLWGADRLFPLNSSLWTLFFELAANLFHAACLRRLGTRAIGAIAAGGGLLLLAAIARHRSMQIGWAADALDGAIGRLVWGYCVGLLLWRLEVAGRLPTWRWPNALVCGLFVLLLVVPSPFGAMRGFLTDLILLPLLLTVAINARLPDRWLGVAAGAGAMSFPLYAIHAPVLEALKTPGAGPIASSAGLWIATSIALVGGAGLIDRVYDRPVRRALTRMFLPGEAPGHAVSSVRREKRRHEH